jgi:penicillin-binding protein 1C
VRRVLPLAIITVLLGPLIALAAIWFTLPGIDALHAQTRAPSSRIVDRHGRLLYEIVDPRSNTAGTHRPVSAQAIPRRLREATIAVEDASFAQNPGVDLTGIARAIWINLRGGETLAGGSTITQQLARMTLLDPEERRQRTLLRKLRESMLAWQIAHRHSKDEVLALYLNESYYGNLAYGVEAASQVYLGKRAAELDLGEAAFLAGLPQSPAAYDPFNDLPLARKRQAIVLDLMARQGYITAQDALQAKASPLTLAPAPHLIRAPHFVAVVRRWAELHLGTEALMRAGLTISTTLDLSLNDAAQRSVQQRLAELANPSFDSPDAQARNAGVIGLVPHTGEVRVMVGSPSYFDAANAGAVNATLALRQPGSAIKPLTYAAALQTDRGFTAATPIIDVRTAFPTREGLPYVPVNYDRKNHGIISARAALATSNNVAAVLVLQRIGIRPLTDLAAALGMQAFVDPDRAGQYGYSLTLGGGEVRLIELTAAYAAFANTGQRVDPVFVTEVRDAAGGLVYRHAPKPGPQVVRPEVAWLITDMLSDNAARAPAFGEVSVLRLDRPAAVKTGTTQDFRDNWTVGFTPDLAVGVWVGNADGTSMQGATGLTGAGPIWNDVMHVAHRGLPARAFVRPAGLSAVEVCALSGMLPTAHCTNTRTEWFLVGTQPTIADTWHQLEQGAVALDLPAPARAWAQAQGWRLVNVDTVSASGVAATMASAGFSRPDNDVQLRLDPALPRAVQREPISVWVRDPSVRAVAVVDEAGTRVATFGAHGGEIFWSLTPGRHTFRLQLTLLDGRVVEGSAVSLQVIEP